MTPTLRLLASDTTQPIRSSSAIALDSRPCCNVPFSIQTIDSHRAGLDCGRGRSHRPHSAGAYQIRWLEDIPGKSRRASLQRKRQNTTSAMPSLAPFALSPEAASASPTRHPSLRTRCTNKARPCGVRRAFLWTFIRGSRVWGCVCGNHSFTPTPRMNNLRSFYI